MNPKFLHLVFEGTKTRLSQFKSPLTLEKMTALTVNFPLMDVSYFNIARGVVPLKQHCDLGLRNTYSHVRPKDDIL